MRRYFSHGRRLFFVCLFSTGLLLACSLGDISRRLDRITLLGQNQPVGKLNETNASRPPASQPILTGRIVDAKTGQALPAALYQIESVDRPVAEKWLPIDDEGWFVIPTTATSLTIQVELPGYQTWQQQIQPADFSPESRVEIALQPNQLSGTVEAIDLGQPLAEVVVLAVTDNITQTVKTDGLGHFELSRLRPGDVITVEPPLGYLPKQAIFDDQVELSLLLAPRLLTVTVRDSFSVEPVQGVAISLNRIITAPTNFRGQVVFSRVPITGSLYITHSGYFSTTLDYQNQAALDMTLTPARLQGVVRDGDTGQALPLTTFHVNGTVFQADEQGQFELDTLPTTPQPLIIKAAGYHRAYAQVAQTGIFTTSPAPFSGVEGRWLTTTACAETLSADDTPCLDIHLEPFAAKVIYIPFGYLRNRDAIISFLDFVATTELNAIIVDVKGDYGFLGWDSEVELAETIGADSQWSDGWIGLAELVREAKKRQVYTIARMVVFKDDPLAQAKPELAVVREDGTVWVDGETLGWANPFKEEVWAYNIALAQEVAAFGFDEINFDYIRFPSDGNLSAITYAEENTAETRTAAIREFVSRMQVALWPYGVFTSADVFGLTVWVEPESDMQIGQRVIDIAPHVDYLAPMIYPSTFISGNLGYPDPSAEPYNVIFRSQTEAMSRVPPYVKVRPWLQAYWYSLEEMQLQKQAAEDANSAGWTWWNAGGSYADELFAWPEEAE